MNYRVAIPSYKRAVTLKDKTLSMLTAGGVSAELIDVFVASDEEAEEYRSVLAAGSYANIIVGRPTLQKQRNFIQRYYAEGQRVMSFDDDLQGIYRRLNDKQLEPVTDLHKMIVEGFSMAYRRGARLWGIYAVLNAMFMSPTVTYDLCYIVGCVWGCVNTHDPCTFVALNDKEDYERSIKFYLADRAVCRLNYYAPKTNYYNEPGGMQEDTERAKHHIEATNYLIAKYPGLIRQGKTRRSSGFFQLTLKDTRKARK